MLSYINYIFFDTSKRLDKQSYLAALGMLWFLNIAGFLSFSSNVFTTYVISQLGAEVLANYALLNRLTSVFFSVGIPWKAIMMVGIMLLIRRAYKDIIKSRLGIIGMGMLGFIAYLGVLATPFYLSGMAMDLFGTSEQFYEANQAIKYWGWGLLPLTIAGLGIILYPIFNLHNQEAKIGSQKGLSREAFGKFYGLLNFLWVLLVLIASRYFSLDSMESYAYSEWAVFGIINLIFMLSALIMAVLRLNNAGKSYGYFLVYLLPILGIVAFYYITSTFYSVGRISVFSILLYFMFESVNLFHAYLFIVPEKEKRIIDSGEFSSL